MQNQWEYTDEFKVKLDHRYTHYKNGGEMVDTAEAESQIEALLKQGKKK